LSLFDSLSRIWKAPLPDGEKVVLAQKEIESNQNVLIDRMLYARGKLDPARLQWFSQVIPISLATAHTNLCIWNRGGRGLFIVDFDGTPATTLLRFNSKSSSIYPIRSGYIKGAFKSLYLTNAAEAGKSLKFVIGYRNFAEYMMLGTASTVKVQDSSSTIIDPATTGNITTLLQTLMNVANPKDYKDLWDVLTTISGLDFAEQTTLAAIAGIDFATQTTLALIKAKTDEIVNLVKLATTPTIYTVTLVSTNTEYDQALPAGTKILRFCELTGDFDIRYAFVTGKVAAPTEPYGFLKAGVPWERGGLNLTGKTLYLAATGTNYKIGVECWV